MPVPLGRGELFQRIQRIRERRVLLCACGRGVPPAAGALPLDPAKGHRPLTLFYALSASNFFMKATSFWTPSTGMAL